MTIYPTPGSNTVYATSGDGWLVGDPGYTYVGYPGNSNTVTYQLATGTVVASLGDPAINTGDAAGDSYVNIQNLTGSPYGSILEGNNSGQTEQLWGLGGSNWLYGGSGYTTFISGPGADAMYAGQGGGLADYEVAASGVTVSLSNPSINSGSAAGDTYSNIHNIAGSAYDDTLIADNHGDNILGGDGNNILAGGNGNDTLNGGPGANIFIGGQGSDWFIFGGSAIGAGDVNEDPRWILYNAEAGTCSRIIDFDQGDRGYYVAGESDRIDVAPLVNSLGDGGLPVTSLVQVVEDTSGSFAWLEFNGPTGWVNLARMDGLQAGETVGVILNESNSAGFAVTVQATQLTSTTNAAEWLLSDGQWSSSVFPGSLPGTDWHAAGTGDFSGNGTTDILWQNVDTGAMATWEMSDGQYAGSINFGNLPFGWQIEGTGDFFHSGNDDILLYNAGDHQADIWEMSNGQWQASINVGTLPGAGWQAAVGDFTGNGTDDILWHNVGSGDVVEWMMSNGQIAGSVDFGTAPAGMGFGGAGQFFGSKNPSDVLWFNPTTGETDIWQMSNGQIAGVAHTGTLPGAGWQVAGLGDFNGDGTTDILWHNVNSGDVAEWFIHDGQYAGSFDFGAAPSGMQVAGVGDFAHSGTSDVLWTQFA